MGLKKRMMPLLTRAEETANELASGSSSSRQLQRTAVLLITVLVVAIAIRVAIYAGRPSLWLDEARLALNVCSRTYIGLLRPLDYDQVAPPLFLWTLKLATDIGGVNEYALRALPLLAGLCIPAATASIALQLAGRREALLAATLTAFSPGLVSQSVQVKPYIIDALVTLLIIAAYLSAIEHVRPRRTLYLTAVGAVAVWASAPSIFVLGAIGAVLIAGRLKQSLTADFRVVTMWAVSFGAAYFVTYRHGSENSYLQNYWAAGFLPFGQPGLPGRLTNQFRDILLEGFTVGMVEWAQFPQVEIVQWAWALLLASCTALGAWTLWHRFGARVIAVTCGPAVLAAGAAVAGLYPLAPRLMLFWAPLLAILIATGLLSLSRAPLPLRVLAIGGLGTAFLVALMWCVDLVTARGEELRPVVQHFQRRVRPGEPVYIFARALPAWTFYTTNWNRPDTLRLNRMAREGSSGGLAFENAPPRERPIGNEGEPLRFSYAGWVELLGAFSGAQWRPGPFQAPRADSNWALFEARRIAHQANPAAWVVLVDARGIDRQLQLAIEQTGGEARYELQRGDVRLIRYNWTRRTPVASP